MPRLDLGHVVGAPGRDASGITVQKWLGKYEYTGEDALVHAQGNVDLGTGGALSIDGVQLGAGDIVLVTRQDDKKENGLYTVQSGSWARLSGYGEEDGAAFDFKYVLIQSGETDAGKLYTIGNEEYAIGETELEFVETGFSVSALPGKIAIRDREGNFEGNGATVPVLTAITVASLPDKSAYTEGDAFNPVGLVVRGIFSDGSLQNINPEVPPDAGISGYVLSSPNMSTTGQKTVAVMYRNLTASFKITVSDAPPVLAGLEIRVPPSQLVYERDETLDLSGILVRAVYSDGSKVELGYDSTGVDGYRVSPPDMSSLGTKTVTVLYNPEAATFWQTFSIEVTLGADYDGVVDNETERGHNLLTVLGVPTVQEAWEILHERINADGLANYHNLYLDDYLDITAGLPAPLNIAWNAEYLNLRIHIVGFNCYKGSQGNTKNHIVWGFKNTPLQDKMNTSTSTNGGYPASTLKTRLDGDFLTSLIAALGADYFYDVVRLVQTKKQPVANINLSAKLWLPNLTEVFGEDSSQSGYDTKPQITLPLYAKGGNRRVKSYNGSTNDTSGYWWTVSIVGDVQYGIVLPTGYSSMTPTYSIGVSPCFCQR
jgi:hypothetical protein